MRTYIYMCGVHGFYSVDGVELCLAAALNMLMLKLYTHIVALLSSGKIPNSTPRKFRRQGIHLQKHDHGLTISYSHYVPHHQHDLNRDSPSRTSANFPFLRNYLTLQPACQHILEPPNHPKHAFAQLGTSPH